MYLLSSQPVSFGAWNGPGQMGKSWEARNIAWHALDASDISDSILTNQANNCAPGGMCDYGVGTHSYQYDPTIVFLANPWRDLPTFTNDNPDDQPITF